MLKSLTTILVSGYTVISLTNAQQGYFYGEEGECRYEETPIQTSSGYQALRKEFGPLSGNRTCFTEIACGESDEYEDFDEEDKNSIEHIMVRFHISGDVANFCYHKIPKETKVKELVSIGGISFENYVVLKDGMILSPRLKLKCYKICSGDCFTVLEKIDLPTDFKNRREMCKNDAKDIFNIDFRTWRLKSAWNDWNNWKANNAKKRVTAALSDMHMYKEMGKNRYEKLRIKTEEKKAYFDSMKMDVPSVSQETTNVDYNANVSTEALPFIW